MQFLSAARPDQWPVVALCLRREGNQSHIGISMRSNDSALEVLHLGGHNQLARDQLDESWQLGVATSLPIVRQEFIAEFCDLVATANGENIPYGFTCPSDCFNKETGELLFGETTLGLTCAAFVLAVFDSAGAQLVRYETWPTPAAEDVDFQRRIQTVFVNHPDPLIQQHGRSACEPGKSRFHPEQVAAAGSLRPLPASYEQVGPVTAKVREKLAEVRGG